MDHSPAQDHTAAEFQTDFKPLTAGAQIAEVDKRCWTFDRTLRGWPLDHQAQKASAPIAIADTSSR